MKKFKLEKVPMDIALGVCNPQSAMSVLFDIVNYIDVENKYKTSSMTVRDVTAKVRNFTGEQLTSALNELVQSGYLSFDEKKYTVQMHPWC